MGFARLHALTGNVLCAVACALLPRVQFYRHAGAVMRGKGRGMARKYISRIRAFCAFALLFVRESSENRFQLLASVRISAGSTIHTALQRRGRSGNLF